MMERRDFKYSMKNIPLPSNSEYITRLIEKTEEFIKRLRWRSYFHLHPEARPQHKETYGFRTRKLPPTITQLKPFEDDLLKMIENIKFRKIRSQLQDKLKRDVKAIKEETKMIVPADKTNNFYTVPVKQYEKLMKDNVTTTYKKADPQAIQKINSETRNIANQLDLSDRIDTFPDKPAYVTMKDHKDNFRNNPTCRLINPTKSELGKIAKQILDRINNEIQISTQVNQWKNTSAVIDWFKAIRNKPNTTFITFDVVNFYPSIDRELLMKALNFAEKYTPITKVEIDVIMQSKDTLLFHNKTPWQKKGPSGLFDVTMGSFDGAETCELVGTYILSEISDIIPKADVGLYRDDGLAIIDKSPSVSERIKKKLCQKFKDLGLKITATSNQRITDFLDVTFDLDKKEYRPYSKPGNTHQYVHIESNHPPLVIKQIPYSIEARLSKISSNEEIFNNSKAEYQTALYKAGHKVELQYRRDDSNTEATNTPARKRRRNITWYNPPYSMHVKTKIGKKFLELLDYHFPHTHELHKICNRNTIKLSYSCTTNMSNIIKAHNNKLASKEEHDEPRCNCRNQEDCPLPGKCTVRNIIYEATVTTTTTNESKRYFGLTSTMFKTRYTSHRASFTDARKKNSTELSKHVWNLKEKGTPHTITWKILKHAQPYNPRSKRCNLCLWEKYFIITANKRNLLNSKSELISTCRHKRKFLLSEYG